MEGTSKPTVDSGRQWIERKRESLSTAIKRTINAYLKDPEEARGWQ
jgi:hypothetical protein